MKKIKGSGTFDPILEVTYTTPTIITYAYDAQGQRIKMVSPAPAGAGQTVTTVYPTKLYNTNGTTPTKHIAGIATVQGTGINAKIYYNHSDSLNSSSVMTDSVGATAETMDYYPFGAIRLDQQATPPPGTTAFSEQRKYIGQEYDPDTNLSYLNARYYNATLARFTSQDPQFWGNQNLSDSQSLNSYSYGNNNPITMSDPTGKDAMTAQALLGTGIGFEGIGAAFDGTIFGASVGIVLGITGIGILAVGGGIYYFDKIQSNQAKGNSGVAGKTTTGAPNPQISGNNQNGKKDENSNNDSGKNSPKSAKNWIEPTNKPQAPAIPEDWVSRPAEGNGLIYHEPGTMGEQNTIRVMRPTEQYPDGYWRAKNSFGQNINPSTGKPGVGTNTEIQSQTHTPLPKGYWGK